MLALIKKTGALAFSFKPFRCALFNIILIIGNIVLTKIHAIY